MLDQRHLLYINTPAEARQRWEHVRTLMNESRVRMGHPLAPPLRKDRRSVAAYVNHDRWVADCPACGGGMEAWPENPEVACIHDGLIFGATFPHANTVRAAKEALDRRPFMENRNWYPDRETPADLRAENRKHGVA